MQAEGGVLCPHQQYFVEGCSITVVWWRRIAIDHWGLEVHSVSTLHCVRPLSNMSTLYSVTILHSVSSLRNVTNLYIVSPLHSVNMSRPSYIF